MRRRATVPMIVTIEAVELSEVRDDERIPT